MIRARETFRGNTLRHSSPAGRSARRTYIRPPPPDRLGARNRLRAGEARATAGSPDLRTPGPDRSSRDIRKLAGLRQRGPGKHIDRAPVVPPADPPDPG